MIETPDKANAVYVAGLMLADERHRPGLRRRWRWATTSSAAARCRRGWATASARRRACPTASASQFSADAMDKSARFMMFAICNPKNIDKVDKAIAEELDKFLKDGVEREGAGRRPRRRTWSSCKVQRSQRRRPGELAGQERPASRPDLRLLRRPGKAGRPS